MNCVNIEGELRLFDDLEELCYTGSHLMIVLTVSLPGLIGWAAGIPIYALIKLNRNMEDLAELKKIAAGKSFDDLQKSFNIRMGFLTAGYSEDYFFWEIVLLMRKTLVVLMIVFLSSVSSGVQSLTAILVMTIFFGIQFKLQPYYDPALNDMETLSLFVIILTIYCGLYYQAGEGEAVMQNQIVTWLIFCGVLIPSIVFAINFIRKMWIEILKQVSAKSVKAFRFLTCGTKDITEFRLQHMVQESESEQSDVDIDTANRGKKEKTLQGFKAEVDDFALQLSKNMKAKLEKEKKNR